MSHDQVLQLQDRLEVTVNQFETEFAEIENLTSADQLVVMIDAVGNLRTVLSEIKTYFVEVRNQLSKVHGIPPAKELAQLVIGASTEAISSLRETEHLFEELKEKLKSKRKTPIAPEEIQYADFSAKEAIRKSQYIIKKIGEQAEELPDQL
jgi:pyruvate dehydrogenase complex dehydrogenase (E1) component